jgi:hypothetical protein
MKLSGGFRDVPQFKIVAEADLATKLGKPQRYRHGWILINPVGEAEKITAAAVPKINKKALKGAMRTEVIRNQQQSAREWIKLNPVAAKHIVAQFKNARPDELHDGMNWYEDAHHTAAAFATHNGVSLKTAAGIIAVYSPQTAWASNMQRAGRVLRTHIPIGGKGAEFMATGEQKEWAQKILDGADWRDVLTGQKIRAFAQLIEQGDDPSDSLVVVDRHALSVAAGARASEWDYAFSRLGGKAKYAKVSKTYIDAAKQLSKETGTKVSPHQVQAVTWLVQQRQNEASERETSPTKAAKYAKASQTAWAEWKKFAKAYYPDLVGKEAQTGYTTLPDDLVQQINLAFEQDPDPEEIDLSYEDGDPTAADTVTVQTPPDEDLTTQQIVAILLAAYTLDQTAKAIADIVPGIDIEVWKATIKATQNFSAHAPLLAHDLEGDSAGASVAKSAARREVVYRAAYIARAAGRIQEDVNGGKTIKEAVRAEVPVYRSHEAARRNRLDAAARVGVAANRFGNLLGWYLDPLLNNERECIVANGHNFHADESTVLGDPGAVHLNCGCVAGPPIAGAGMVNDAVAASRQVIFEEPRKYGLRREAS